MNNLATSLCDHFKSVGVACPLSLQSGLFTVGAIDNLDHDPSSTTAQGSFHGAGISLFQFPKQDSDVSQPAVQRIINLCSARSASRDITLPDTYSSVPPVSIKTSEVNVPATSQVGVETVSTDELSIAIEKQVHWLKHREQHLNEELTKGIHLSWAAYHASVTELPNPSCLGSLLPLFYEMAATIAMMKHEMSVIKKATEFLNPGQIPVTVCDQPLFAIAKVVQLNWPATHGENVHVVMLGAYTLRWCCGPCVVTF